MADLDDFFAKKDRKKPKGKKFTTTDEVAKKLEEKKVDKPAKKEKMSFPSSMPGENDINDPKNEEEEWKEFQEEKKDYSGLKIQNLTIQDENSSENADAEDDGEMEENEQGEFVRKKKGPWKAIEAEAPAPAPVAAAPPQPPPPKAEQNGRPNVYISPHMRQQSQQQQQQQQLRDRMPRGRMTAAPDITNTEFFPTLTAASNETPASWGRKAHEGAFEEVRNSRSHSNRETRVTQRLEIGNKFGALQTENS